MDGVAIRLGEYTTLRLGGPAAGMVTADDEEKLISAVRERDETGAQVLVLGGGSNLVISDAGFPGTVVHVATRGDAVVGSDPERSEVHVEAAAGQDWDEFVARTVEAGYGGLECLSGIPGKVGATPIQNVGAYGWEVAQFLRWVRLYDRRRGETVTLLPDDLELAYRTSNLKGTDTSVVLSVCFALHTDGLSQPVRYGELARALGAQPGTRVPGADVRAAVLELRRSKGMVLDAEDRDTWSAGSFFTNPIVGEAELPAVLERVAEAVGADVAVPQFPVDTGVKLSAAWLIERAGFGKGYRGPGGRVSLSGKHTLALTNRGTASTADLLDLAREVRDGVAARFGVVLHPEPLLINCSL
ncbi:UDP-N-acetylmuramate dehydrogenase [Haloechinothrix alba]|uniref:UDP-N-acetylenolpyruvoylglucosamine reductase n=1 Tax=Haloechinothrix alba TaxID=664784 RepID=A0A238W1W9_9PSEU|nr:UDP-N-acetylmuramate dehydrogenase [Haloechinothrix alba]SNR40401.1 UDP-N-acetylmuramate dehydrogenase [Haloechinothrix alba]